MEFQHEAEAKLGLHVYLRLLTHNRFFSDYFLGDVYIGIMNGTKFKCEYLNRICDRIRLHVKDYKFTIYEDIFLYYVHKSIDEDVYFRKLKIKLCNLCKKNNLDNAKNILRLLEISRKEALMLDNYITSGYCSIILEEVGKIINDKLSVKHS